jgi:S-adenosylmethionine:tRNA ribosyltransferase-isomerase
MEKKVNFTLEDFFYDLPEELVAQFPVQQRDNSRLFVIDRKSDTFLHSYFKNIIIFFKKGSVSFS